jgi:DNA polymerase-3 subunit alpha
MKILHRVYLVKAVMFKLQTIVPPCEDWSTMEKISQRKEVVGIYISGHPLDDYKFEMKYFCNAKLRSPKI